MTTLNQTLGAPPTRLTNWKHIIWRQVENHVRRLQVRIAKAIKLGRHGKAKALQWILTHSYYAKLLAVKRVTQNKGKNTPGVDGIIWKTPSQKLKAANCLKRKGYKSKPLRRIYILKKNGKQRPLGIPTKSDMAQQALHLLALEPISETLADKNSFGFRPKRSIHDAIGQCFNLLAKKNSSKWILEGDIKTCFDKISHTWMLNNIHMDKTILKQWLKAGYMENNVFHATRVGSPQGGIASPTIANQVLDGLEMAVTACSNKGNNVQFVRYADDFICTAPTKEILEQKVLPIIIDFLKERDLELSMEKTKITHIDEGFDFLGFNLRKYKGKLLIKPTDKGTYKFLEEIKQTIKTKRSSKASDLINVLNSKIRGWANHFQYVVAKKTFSYVDSQIFSALWRWAKRRHPNKNKSWIKAKYFTKIGSRDWCFYAPNTKDAFDNHTLLFASNTKIIRYVKIRKDANPYDPEFQEYFQRRQCRRTSRRGVKRSHSRVTINGL
jgi:RNA-directed DNA polymerase